MGLITGAIIAGAVIAGAGVAAAQAKKSASKKAAKARENALAKVKAAEPQTLNERARIADEERFSNQLDLQRRLDPDAARTREGALKELAGTVRTDTDRAAESTAKRAFEELAAPNPEMDALRAKLLSDAKAELDMGASLSPEFQAELVSAGLERSTASGVGASRMGASGQTARKLIGAAGEQLKAQRRGNATAVLGNEAQVQSARQQVLAGLSSQLMGIGQARQARAAVAFGLAQQAAPEAGLSGREMATLEVAKQNTENQKALGFGEIKAGEALAKGQYIADLAGTAASAVTTGIGAYGSFGGGAGATAASRAAPAAAPAGAPASTGGYYNGGFGYTLR